MVSHHLVNFGGHGHCGVGDVIILVYYVISQDHVIKVSCDFYVQKIIKVNYHPAKFSEYRHSSSGDIMVKWSCGFMGKSP